MLRQRGFQVLLRHERGAHARLLHFEEFPVPKAHQSGARLRHARKRGRRGARARVGKVKSFIFLLCIKIELRAVAPSVHLNFVFLFSLFALLDSYEALLGVAGLPWSSADAPPTGGLIINSGTDAWGVNPASANGARYGTTAVHEMGHALGLLVKIKKIKKKIR